MMHWTSNLLICSLASLLLAKSVHPATKYGATKGGGEPKLSLNMPSSPGSNQALKAESFTEPTKSMPVTDDFHTPSDTLKSSDNANKESFGLTQPHDNNDNDNNNHHMYQAIKSYRPMDDNSVNGNQLDYGNDYNGEAIRAAVKSRHTFDYKDVHVEPLQITPKTILVEASSVPLRILFQTKSTALNLQNEHVPAKGSVQETHSEDEPHRLIHNVYRRIIQEINEIVQPYRMLQQRIEPVIETMKTIIAKAGPMKSNNINEQGYNQQQQLQQQPEESYGKQENKIEQSYVSENEPQQINQELLGGSVPTNEPVTPPPSFSETIYNKEDVLFPNSRPVKSMPKVQALILQQQQQQPQISQYQESQQQQIPQHQQQQQPQISQYSQSQQQQIPQHQQQQQQQEPQISQYPQSQQQQHTQQQQIPQHQQPQQFQIPQQQQQLQNDQAEPEGFQKKQPEVSITLRKAFLKRKNFGNFQQIKNQKQLQMFMNENTMKSAPLKLMEPLDKPAPPPPVVAPGPQPADEDNESLELPASLNNGGESLPLIKLEDLEESNKSAELNSVPAIDDIGIGEEVEVQPQLAASTQTSTINVAADNGRQRRHQKRSQPVIMFYNGGSIPRLIAQFRPKATTTATNSRQFMKKITFVDSNAQPTEY